MLVCLGIVVFGFGVLGVHGTGESAYGERQSDAAGTEISTGLLSDLSAQITSVDLRGAVRLLLLPTPLVTTTAATTVMSASIETACEGEKRTRNHLEYVVACHICFIDFITWNLTFHFSFSEQNKTNQKNKDFKHAFYVLFCFFCLCLFLMSLPPPDKQNSDSAKSSSPLPQHS